MTDGHFRAQASPSPQTGPPVLPPLSKFYCGPATGWSSAGASPSHNGSTWSLVNPPTDQALSGPARASPSLTSSQWPNQESQGWHSGPPTSTIPPKNFPDSYAMMQGNRNSPLNPGWDSRPTSSSMDTSTWGVNYNRPHGDAANPIARPPLPVSRFSKWSPHPPLKTADQIQPRPEHTTETEQADRDRKRYSPHSKYSSQHPSARGSATTIDVPLFLQPQPFDPETAPPLPQRPSSPIQDRRASPRLSSNSQQLPPPPPKIPLASNEAEPQHDQQSHSSSPQVSSLRHSKQDSQNLQQPPVTTPMHHLRSDHQRTFNLGHSKGHSQSSMSSTSSRKRPHFDPQNSHDAEGNPAGWQSQSQRLTQPNQSASSINTRNTPLTATHQDLSYPNEQSHQTVTARLQNSYEEENRYQMAQRLHKQSISPVQEGDRWAASPYPNRWASPAAHAPSPEPQHATLPQQDGRSTSATEASSNMPNTSTPESHQTSNTSLKDDDAREPGGGEGDSNDSFYWHSGRSSSESDNERSSETALATQHSRVQSSTASQATTQTVRIVDARDSYRPKPEGSSTGGALSRFSPQMKPEISQSKPNYEVRGLPARSSSLSPNPQVEYSSSALGYGGPSDWEYFGDYEAEEVDDEELYAHKPRAELPASIPITEEETFTIPDQASGSQVNKPGLFTPPSTGFAIQEEIHTKTTPFASPENQTVEEDPVYESKWSPSTTPTTPHANSSRPLTVTSEPLPSEDQRPDLEEVIRAWSDDPHVGRNLDTESMKQAGVRQFENEYIPGEASLASTPGESVLGVYAIPNDAPPIPKLPESIDFERHSLAPKSPIRTPQEGTQADSADVLQTRLSVAEGASNTHGHDTVSADATLADGQIVQGATPPVAETSKEDTKLSRTPANTEDDNEAAGQSATLFEVPSHHETLVAGVFANGCSDAADSIKGPISTPTTYAETTSLDGSNTEIFHKPTVSNDPAFATPQTHTEDSRSKPAGLHEPQKVASAPETVRKPQISVDIPGAALGRTGSPISEFARKRQMFESPGESKFSPLSLPRKPVQDAKPSPIHSSNSEEFKACDIKTSDRSVDNLSKGPSAAATSTNSLKTSPTVSQKPSRDYILDKSPETLRLIARSTSSHSKRSSKRTSQEDVLSQAQPATADTTAAPGQEAPKSLDRTSSGPENHNTAPVNSIETFPDPASELQIRMPAPSPTPSPQFSSATNLENLAGNVSKISVLGASTTTLPRPLSGAMISTESKSCQADIANDPYADLDPWGRASLNRFAAMLREEGRAESNKDKLNIFNVFASRESRLRVVLYGSDEELILATKAPAKQTDEPRKVPSSKLQHLAKASAPRKVVQRSNTTKTQGAAKELPPYLRTVIAREDKEQSQADTEKSESPQYSPGGRPIVQRLSRNSKDISQSQGQSSTEFHPPEVTKSEDLGNTNLGTEVAVSTNTQAHEEKQNPAYTKPKFNEDGVEVKNYLTNRRSIYRPFATQTLESMVHTINFGAEPELSIEEPPLPNGGALPDIKDTSESACDNEKPSTVAPSVDLRHFVEADFDPLVMALPASEVVNEDSVRLAEFKKVLEGVPDDFSFIHASVLAWDATVKKQREENERQRHARQIESEQRIDALFDDHEIGYGDIAELEGEFKQSEAAKKAEEDRFEYELFIENVFNVVWTRLHFEVDQLRPHYDQFSKLMDETLAGKDIFGIPEAGLSLAPTMTAFLGLHQKLEIRHQKAFEAVLERDRRLKKTEISPWYSLSNLAKVKQLEKQFEDAEKKAIIGYCQERNERANQLMDVLDQNTLRGVGANQDYMEAVMKAVRRIASGRAYASVPGLEAPTRGIELVEKAKTITALVAASSEQIVQTFHVADMLLNSADYEVSVAKAKVARADLATLTKLKEERTKEDLKLMRDLEHRLALIREDSRRTNDEIIKLMLFLGIQNSKALSAHPIAPALRMQQQQQATAGAKDPGHEAQTFKSLDEPADKTMARDGMK
ncbi:uncharacterized protein KY384_009061 [Bacidia gigantensis]|uniref:uncharacterized protein n=1 Tax=Bacidia gigantensis TaxID=2732470 RepID=UPI001D052EE2|nr:uncharacterized protein KY384_009061 [Bacidia gigantensis]KAG8525417.1 hypothetical protein KY384_009061 [Bacidia gigantensis]